MITYLELGIRHILDLRAYDHMLFLLTLVANHRWNDLKNVALLATAFTAGHSVTLALTVTGNALLPVNWVEFLIPLTILFTAGFNLLPGKRGNALGWKYALAAGFGLVHGMGFAGYLLPLLGTAEMTVPLLGFNLGVEAGQLIFLAVILAINFALHMGFANAQRYWSKAVNLTALTVSIHLTLQSWPV